MVFVEGKEYTLSRKPSITMYKLCLYMYTHNIQYTCVMLLYTSMVCVGVFVGCKRGRSIKDYVISAAIVIGILFGLRMLQLCCIAHRLLKKDNSRSESDDENPNHGLELQPPEITSHAGY